MKNRISEGGYPILECPLGRWVDCALDSALLSGRASKNFELQHLQDADRLLKIAPYIAWNNVGGELALFDSRDGAYHALNASGAAIWRAIAEGLDPPGIARALAEEHDAPPGEIEQDVRDFLDLARAKGLLEERD